MHVEMRKCMLLHLPKTKNKNAREILWKASYLLGELGPMVVFVFRGRAAGICDWQTYSVCLQRSYLIRFRCPPKSWRLLFEIQIGLSLSRILYPYQILNRSYIASAIASSSRSPLYAFSKFLTSLSEPFADCSTIHSLLSPSNLLLVCFVRPDCSLTFIYTPAQAYFFFPSLFLSLSLICFKRCRHLVIKFPLENYPVNSFSAQSYAVHAVRNRSAFIPIHRLSPVL